MSHVWIDVGLYVIKDKRHAVYPKIFEVKGTEKERLNRLKNTSKREKVVNYGTFVGKVSELRSYISYWSINYLLSVRFKN